MFISNKFFVTLWWKNIMHRVNVCILFYPFIKTIVCFWHFISFHRPVSRVNVIKIGMSRCDEIRPIIQAFQFDWKTVSFRRARTFEFLEIFSMSMSCIIITLTQLAAWWTQMKCQNVILYHIGWLESLFLSGYREDRLAGVRIKKLFCRLDI